MAALLAATVGVPAARAGQQQAFRGGVHTVPVHASVIDRPDDLRTDLPQDDFEVYDDGKRQPLTLFTNTQQPITVAGTAG